MCALPEDHRTGISLSGFNKAFSDTPVLREINWHLRRGQIYLLTGSNGAGKSVLAKCASGLESLDSGKVLVDGEEVRELPRGGARKAGIQYVAQSLQAPRGIGGGDILALRVNCFFFTQNELIARIKKQLEDWNITTNLPWEKQLSDFEPGQLQLLHCMSLALAPQPTLVFLDEPTSHLDLEQSSAVSAFVKQLANKGVAFVVIAHPDQAFFGADEQWVLDGGDLRPATPSVAEDATAERLNYAHCTWVAQMDHDGMSIVLRRGEIVGLSGPDTNAFHKLIARLLRGGPTLWRVEPGLTQLIWRSLPPDASDRLVADSLSLSENLLIGHWNQCKVSGLTRTLDVEDANNRIASPLRTAMQITAKLELPVSTLSGGNRQRLVVARTCFGRVDVVVAVKLTRGLDPAGVQVVLRHVVERAEAGVAFLLVDTDLGKQRSICQNVIAFGDSGASGTGTS